MLKEGPSPGGAVPDLGTAGVRDGNFLNTSTYPHEYTHLTGAGHQHASFDAAVGLPSMVSASVPRGTFWSDATAQFFISKWDIQISGARNLSPRDSLTVLPTNVQFSFDPAWVGGDSYRIKIFDSADGIVFDTLVTDTSFTKSLPAETPYSWSTQTVASNGDTSGWSPRSYFVTDKATGIGIENTSIPDNFTLNQNYPNPFNPSTVISYQLSTASFVTLKVFDILGREIVTLVNKEQSAGSYSFTFDASGLASGIYLYRISAGQSFIVTKKMTLLK